jgi:hypothetical protein
VAYEELAAPAPARRKQAPAEASGRQEPYCWEALKVGAGWNQLLPVHYLSVPRSFSSTDPISRTPLGVFLIQKHQKDKKNTLTPMPLWFPGPPGEAAGAGGQSRVRGAV